jgi:hypothetical protein
MHPHGVNLRTARGTGSHLTARQAVESDRQFLTIPAFESSGKLPKKILQITANQCSEFCNLPCKGD